MIDSEIPKTAGLAGLEGLLNLFSKRQQVWQTLERFSFLSVKLCERGEFAPVATVIDNLLFVAKQGFISWKPRFHQDKYETQPAALKNFVLDWELCPSLGTLLFSEFGRFAITNQTHR